MSGSWQEPVWSGFPVPAQELDDETRAAKRLPRTLRTTTGEGVEQRLVFEPALKQYENAFRAMDPVFTDPPRGEVWRAARRRALELVLAAIGGSEWADSLVLRGSVLMSAWFGAAAREPGDLDFVVLPHSWRIDEARTARLFDGVAAAAESVAAGRGAGVAFDAREAVLEDIWTYDRVPGRRMVLPWSAPGLPGGHVQLDFVFNEELAEAPEPAELPDGTVLLAATPALSLAWKLMWLIDDAHPQGKDLYDAVLLAERHPLAYDLLLRVFRLSGSHTLAGRHRQEITPADVSQAAGYVEWDHFVTEYPAFTHGEREFADRLIQALVPTFAGRSESPGPVLP
ncbi:nucleotidyl transferase AbiEii/AbiGii toxin family protein [Streptomyces sp. NPDC047043]|uniref:nucleotidyl transferase AbiEii/AbiGii toxin family protein n=1 Tax=Streptomyces sp. NPDC047043 TaxID=3154497 RepID=UPI003406E521